VGVAAVEGKRAGEVASVEHVSVGEVVRGVAAAAER
jgi:hypothetical protein